MQLLEVHWIPNFFCCKSWLQVHIMIFTARWRSPRIHNSCKQLHNNCNGQSKFNIYYSILFVVLWNTKSKWRTKECWNLFSNIFLETMKNIMCSCIDFWARCLFLGDVPEMNIIYWHKCLKIVIIWMWSGSSDRNLNNGNIDSKWLMLCSHEYCFKLSPNLPPKQQNKCLRSRGESIKISNKHRQ